MKIAVTGGSGFIGAATVQAAKEAGHDAWSFDRAHGDDILGDLQHLRGADTVIHLAGLLGTAELFDTPFAAVDYNITGSLKILEWCRHNGAGYVGICMPDSSWRNLYQATKLCAIRLAAAYHANLGVPVSHVRAFNAYGPGQKWGPGHPQKILPTFAVAAWRGQPIPIWGSGRQTVDLVHVDDVARMLVAATRFGNDEVFDAGTGVSVEVNMVAGMVNTYCGRNQDNVEWSSMRLGEVEDTHIRAEGDGWDLLGWRPEFDWDRVRDTVDSYREQAL